METHDRIQEVLKGWRELTAFGFRTTISRRTGPAPHAPVDFQKERDELLLPEGVRQVEAAMAYLDKVRHAKSASGPSAMGSYALKHEVEAWYRASGQETYIGNGAVIVAAILRGLQIHRPDRRSPNCGVGIHLEDVRALREGIDPQTLWRRSGFVRWLFAQAKREDPVGDLASDAVSDLRFPRAGDMAAIREYLGRHGDHIQEALEAAIIEYRGRRRPARKSGPPAGQVVEPPHPV